MVYAKEKDIQKTITDYLTLKKIFFYRNNTGSFKTERGGFYRFGAIGSPDIICVIKGQFIGIECKAPKGRQTDHQKEFQRNLERCGGKYILAKSLDDVTKHI